LSYNYWHIHTMNCNFATLATLTTCPLALTTYEYNELQGQLQNNIFFHNDVNDPNLWKLFVGKYIIRRSKNNTKYTITQVLKLQQIHSRKWPSTFAPKKYMGKTYLTLYLCVHLGRVLPPHGPLFSFFIKVYGFNLLLKWPCFAMLFFIINPFNIHCPIHHFPHLLAS
jgi:hypothetical protein